MPLPIGETVFCTVVAGTCTKQLEQIFAAPDDHAGNVPGPLEIRSWPAVPVPMFWKLPVAVDPPTNKPSTVVDDNPVPPCATFTAVNPAPRAPEVKVPTPVMLLAFRLALRSPLLISEVERVPLE